MQTTVAEEIASVTGLSTNEILPLTSTSVQCENCIDYSNLILELKDKVSRVSKPLEKIQILTLIPNSWSRKNRKEMLQRNCQNMLKKKF